MGNNTSTLAVGANLPPDWAYYGCYTDYGRRKLAGPSYMDTGNMTQASCVAFCNDNGNPYAGVEYGQECYCGFVIGAGSASTNDTECDFQCSGANGEACGSNNRLSVFYSELLDDTSTNTGPNGTSRIGCLTDNVYARALSLFQASADDMTVAQCTSSCKAANYSTAGLEYGRECWCGDTLNNNATITDEGCDMRCAGNPTEFCGGNGRLDLYALNIIAPTDTTNSTLAAPSCSSTANANPFVMNGGFEEGLANWTAVAYNSSSSTFEIGLTNDSFEGCTALAVVPKPDSKSLSQHFQTSATLTNLEPSQNYTIDLSIGHRAPVSGRSAISDPKYTVRLSDASLGNGAICGFSYTPCPLTGRNNSIYTTLSLPFQADSTEETLTVYLSWYNGNFDVPLYLDGITVKVSSDNTSDPVERTVSPNWSSPTAASEPPSSVGSTASSLTSDTIAATSIAAVQTKKPGSLGLTCKTPEACPDRPKLEITNKTLSNGGFEDGLQDWDFIPEAGNFDITLTSQSFEGTLAASVTPRSTDTSSERSISIRTRMTNLNSSHEWYTVQFHIGHPANFPLANDSPPWLTLSYKSEVTGDIQRRVGLCGEVNLPFVGGPGECESVGADGALFQRYGMDTRSFYSTDQVYTNSTEMEIELQVVWPAGVPAVPVLVDAMHVWEIEWGTVSK